MTSSKLKWQVHYKDGRVLTEDEIPYKELDREQVDSLSIVRKNDGSVVYSTNILEGDNFAYRRRTKTKGTGDSTEVCHVVMRFTEAGNKFTFVFDSTGATIAKDTFDPNTKWFYSPKFAEFETLK